MFQAISYFDMSVNRDPTTEAASVYLEAITDTEHWDSELKHLGVNMWCILVVDGVWRSGKNDPYEAQTVSGLSRCALIWHTFWLELDILDLLSAWHELSVHI